MRFSKQEIEFLKDHCELELIEAENYITDLKNILRKLGSEMVVQQSEKPAGKRRGRPKKKEQPNEKAEAVIAPPAPEKPLRKKPGPKPKKKKTTRKPRTAVKIVKEPVPLPGSTEEVPVSES
jgi:hypothetical protein